MSSCSTSFVFKCYRPYRCLAKLELRTLNIAAPYVDRAANRIDNRLMRGLQPAVAPAELHGESPRRLSINMHRLTVDVPAGAHADRRLVNAQEMVRAHDIVERLHFKHDMLQSWRLAGHARSERQTVVALVAA